MPKYLSDQKFKLLPFLFFEIKGAKKDKIFQIFNQPFSRNGGPYGYDFWIAFRDLSEASKKYHFQIFFKIQQKL